MDLDFAKAKLEAPDAAVKAVGSLQAQLIQVTDIVGRADKDGAINVQLSLGAIRLGCRLPVVVEKEGAILVPALGIQLVPLAQLDLRRASKDGHARAQIVPELDVPGGGEGVNIDVDANFVKLNNSPVDQEDGQEVSQVAIGMKKDSGVGVGLEFEADIDPSTKINLVLELDKRVLAIKGWHTQTLLDQVDLTGLASSVRGTEAGVGAVMFFTSTATLARIGLARGGRGLEAAGVAGVVGGVGVGAADAPLDDGITNGVEVGTIKVIKTHLAQGTRAVTVLIKSES